jgi:hypothetical protein
MAEHRALIWVSVCALLLPFVIATRGSEEYVMSYWIFAAAPQLVVIGLALVSPSLRTQFAAIALVLLSILLLAFLWIISLDANGPMLWMFYFPASAIVVLVVLGAWLLLKRKGKSRGL